MKQTRGKAARRRRGVLIMGLLLLLTGCSVRNDPHYNPFAPHNGRPTVLQRADKLVRDAERGLDNAEQRFNNLVD